MTHIWAESEIEELLKAAVLDLDAWGYCTVCGEEICPVEPDAGRTWCEGCGQVVKIDGLRSLGLI
jgi:hypothetical protein